MNIILKAWLGLGLLIISQPGWVSEGLKTEKEDRTVSQKHNCLKSHVQKHGRILRHTLKPFIDNLDKMRSEALLMRGYSDVTFKPIKDLKKDYEEMRTLSSPRINLVWKYLEDFKGKRDHYISQYQMPHLILYELHEFYKTRTEILCKLNAGAHLTPDLLNPQILIINKMTLFIKNFLDTIIDIADERREFLILIDYSNDYKSLTRQEFETEIVKCEELVQNYEGIHHNPKMPLQTSDTKKLKKQKIEVTSSVSLKDLPSAATSSMKKVNFSPVASSSSSPAIIGSRLQLKLEVLDTQEKENESGLTPRTQTPRSKVRKSLSPRTRNFLNALLSPRPHLSSQSPRGER